MIPSGIMTAGAVRGSRQRRGFVSVLKASRGKPEKPANELLSVFFMVQYQWIMKVVRRALSLCEGLSPTRPGYGMIWTPEFTKSFKIMQKLSREQILTFIMLGCVAAFIGIGIFIAHKQSDFRIKTTSARFAAHFVSFEKLDPPMPAPDVPFLGPDGKQLSLQEMRGEYVLINFWATWCPPCLKELPTFEKMRNSLLLKNVEILAISVDRDKTFNQQVDFLVEHGIGSVALYKDHTGGLRRGLSLESLPVTYLIDPEGRIIYIMEGDTDWSSQTAIEFVRAFETKF